MFKTFDGRDSIQSQGMLSDNETTYARKPDCVTFNSLCFKTIASAFQQHPEGKTYIWLIETGGWFPE